jgi:hypothetical protein
MAVETLKIVLTADNKQAIAGMNETVNSLNKVSAAGAATGGAVTKMGSNFTGLSRVIQDLPYGFNAIANNLTNILPAAGALGLGISALVAGLQFAQLGFGSWTRGLEGVLGTTNLATQINAGYVKSLSEEKTKLDNLFRVAEDNNQSLKVRQQAVNSLRESYGSYLLGYTNEEILVGKASKAHGELTEALKKQSIAQAALTLAAPVQQKILEKQIEQENERAKFINEYVNARGTTTSGGTGGVAIISQENQRLALRNDLSAFYLKTNHEIFELQKEYNKIQDVAAKNAGVGLKIEKDPQKGGGGKTKEVAVKDENKALEEQIQIYKRLQQGMMGQGFIMQEKAKEKDLTNLKLTMDGNAALNEITATQLNLKDQMNARTELANQLTDRAMQGITGIANAMVNGGNIGQAFGDMFKQLAIDIAMAAAKAAIFQAILSAINPVGGASKAGGFLKGFGKLLGFAEGGTVSGPSSGYPVMLHGTEHIVRPDQMKSIIASASQMGGSAGDRVEVYGRIRGNDIYLSQQRNDTFRNLTT